VLIHFNNIKVAVMVVWCKVETIPAEWLSTVSYLLSLVLYDALKILFL